MQDLIGFCGEGVAPRRNLIATCKICAQIRPLSSLDFLGFTLDTELIEIRLPRAKLEELRDIQYASKKSPISVPFRFISRSVFLPVSTVPVRSVPYRSVPFRSLPF